MRKVLFQEESMTPKIKKTIVIGLAIALIVIILKISSDLDNVQIGLTVFFGRLVFWTSKQKNQIKYPGASVGLLGSLFLLCLGYFPLFQESPNNENYSATQSRHIIVNSNLDTSIISIKQGGFTKNQELSQKTQEIFLKEAKTSTITFTNKSQGSKSLMTIQFPDQTTVAIYPNTTFSLEVSGSKQTVNKISGKIEYTTGQSNNTKIYNAEFKNISDFIGQGIWQKYIEDRRKNLIQKAGGPLMENETVRAISHNMLLLAAKIRPNHYLPYLENEKAYETLLNRRKENKTQYENNTQENTNDIAQQAKQAGSKTRFLQFLNK